MTAFIPYAPLNTLKPFGPDIWTVDGPEIRMDYGPSSITFPTRLTVVRLAGGGLWMTSPVAPGETLLAAIDRTGRIAGPGGPKGLQQWSVADGMREWERVG